MSALRPLARRALCLAVSLTAGLRLVGDIDVSRAARLQIHDKRRGRRIGTLLQAGSDRRMWGGGIIRSRPTVAVNETTPWC